MSLVRAAARLLLPQLFNYGLGANAAINELRRLGYGYRRNQMLRDYRSVTGKMKLQDTVEALPGDVRPGRNAIVEVELRQPERSYRVFGEIDIYDWEEGRWKSKNISFYDDTLRSKDDWGWQFRRQQSSNYAAYKQTIERVNIFAIEHNKGHLY